MIILETKTVVSLSKKCKTLQTEYQADLPNSLNDDSSFYYSFMQTSSKNKYGNYKS